MTRLTLADRQAHPRVAAFGRLLGRAFMHAYKIAAVLALASLAEQAAFGPWMLMPGFIFSIIAWIALSGGLLAAMTTSSDDAVAGKHVRAP